MAIVNKVINSFLTFVVHCFRYVPESDIDQSTSNASDSDVIIMSVESGSRYVQ